MRSVFAYAAWLIVSLLVLSLLRTVVRQELPGYSGLVMGVAFAGMVYGFFVIKARLSARRNDG